MNHRNFAIRIGYVGTQYHGYQAQKKSDLRTVEKELKDILGLSLLSVLCYIIIIIIISLVSSLKCGLGRVTVCGRTDRDVSAINQIVNFCPVNTSITPQEVINAVRESSACKEGRLVVYDCVRAPQKFNSRSSAIWRRYTYLFPVNRIVPGKTDIDIDIDRLNTILQKYVITIMLLLFYYVVITI